EALRAASQSQDFGQLFLGFSIFIVVSALLLMGLLFQFGLEQRLTETGILLALGFTPSQVRRLYLLEGLAVAGLGGLVGAPGGIVYAKAMLWGLTTVWRGATGVSTLEFHVSGLTLVTGFVAATVVAVFIVWLALRKQARVPAGMLLACELAWADSRITKSTWWLGIGCAATAAFLVGWCAIRRETSNPGVFFAAGALLLIAGVALAATWLGRLATQSCPLTLTLSRLAVSGCARRRTRSLATISLLALGAFVIAALSVFRLDANEDATLPSSGTGGFASLGTSALPVVQDLNAQTGRDFYGLSEADLRNIRFVPFRVHQGDEASCLNLNRAQKPRLLGVNPSLLTGRFAFAAAAEGLDRRAGWDLISVRRSRPFSVGEGRAEDAARNTGSTRTAPSEFPEIAAIGDANSIQWALGKRLGDTLDYIDGQGRPFKVRLVAAVANSVLQGNLIIDETEFVRRFPNENGYRFFLIDAPTNELAKLSTTLSRALQDVGFEVTPAVDRLNAFNAVQNTYLGTFQILGGLGLLLGSAGLGVVVLRNVLERRGELGLLAAVGYRRRTLRWLVLGEHAALLAAGLGLGILAAGVAVLPSILSPSAQLPIRSLSMTLTVVLVNGVLWTVLALRFAFKGDLLAALRNE
ncbi:MAG TPA: ABC transporter permease, partial [Verrucomicrobiae bacterium]